MQVRSLAALCGAILLALSIGGAAAQQGDPLTRFLDQLFQRGQAPPNMYPNGYPQDPYNPYPRRYYRERVPVRPARPVQRRVPPATVIVRDAPQKPKPDADTFIFVMGDTLADNLADGLEQAFSDVPTIAVSRNTRPSSGLVRSDFYDWAKAVQDRLSGKDPITIGVMMIGMNDRQAIRDGETSVELGTDRWKELYAARVDAIEKAFAEKHVPLIWVGLPPMKSEKLSADAVDFNSIYRERTEKAGGTYVDIWEGFVNDDNRFTTFGPDVKGQTVRLRLGDGIHFTKAGARKAAHFAELQIRRLLEQRNSSTVLALPGTDAKEEPAAQPQAAPKPVAGPILPLTRRDRAPGGKLASAPPSLTGEAAALVDRVYGAGRVVDPRPGRADDFTWPRSE